jgi:uncharacterized membrane protein
MFSEITCLLLIIAWCDLFDVVMCMACLCLHTYIVIIGARFERYRVYRGRVTRVNSTNVLNEGLRIGEIGRRMNSKVKLVEIGVYRK